MIQKNQHKKPGTAVFRAFLDLFGTSQVGMRLTIGTGRTVILLFKLSVEVAAVFVADLLQNKVYR